MITLQIKLKSGIAYNFYMHLIIETVESSESIGLQYKINTHATHFHPQSVLVNIIHLHL